MSEEKFDYDAMQDSEAVGKLLLALIDGLEKGAMVLTSGDETLELSPEKLVKFSLKARKKAESSKLTIKIAWKHPDRFSASSPLSIES
jgi:amphi-Trp domain-containing protein